MTARSDRIIATLSDRLGELQRENTRILSALAAWYGLSVPCDKCGAPAWKPCMADSGRFTVHSPRVTKAAAGISADDLLRPEDPAGGPEQDRGAAAIRPAGTHAFLPAPFYPDKCDAQLDDRGRQRTCARPRSEHGGEQ